MKRLAYILFLFLLVAAHAAAQEDYEIDVVCKGSQRTYRVDGEKGSTWKWMLADSDREPMTLDNETGTDFAARNTQGDSIWGSEITIIWAVDTGNYYLSVEQTSIFGCDSVELGYVMVIPGPEAYAGDEIFACAGSVVELEDAWAKNYSQIMWTTFGDGTFNDSSLVRPAYFPGPGDEAAGSVTLSMVVLGEGKPGGCNMDVSPVTIYFSDPVLELVAVNPVCNSLSTGSVTATVTNGFAPYSFTWTGPEEFTADTKDITGLVAGWYYLTVTDSLGCEAQDSIEIAQPGELLLVLDSIAHNDCYGDMNGYARMIASGGSGVFTWLWDTNPAQIDSVATGLAAGIYIVVVTDENGCEARDTIEITQPEQLLADVLPETLCESDSILLTATVTGGTGTYTHAWSGDGAVWLNDTSLVQPLFAGAPAGIWEIVYTVTDENGCEVKDTVDVTVEPLLTRTEDITVCETALPVTWYGKVYELAGTYTDTIVSVAGCDTIVNLNLIIEPLQKDTLELIVCESELPYIWFGYTFTGDSTITDTIPSFTDGCDTVRTLVLNVKPMLTRTDYVVVCESDLPYIWYGNSFNVTGVYTDTITATAGCDTLATLNLIIDPQIMVTLEQTICDNQLPFVWYGETFTAADTIIQIVSGTGIECDTIRTLIVHVEPQIEITLEKTIWDNQLPYGWYGETFTAADTIIQVLPGTGIECDTIRTLILLVEPQSEITLEQTICDNQLPFVWYGETFTAADTVIQVVPGTGGESDTIRTLVLHVEPQIEITFEQTICDNQLPFVWFGETFTAADTIIQIVPGAGEECDTIRTLVLKVEPQIEITLEQTICDNQLPFVWLGATFTAADTIIQTLPATGTECDTIRTLVLKVEPQIEITFEQTICDNQLPFVWLGATFTAADTIIQIVPGAGEECDTIRTLVLNVEPQIEITLEQTICDNQLPFVWLGETFTAADTIIQIVPGTGTECDTIRTLVLKVEPQIEITLEQTICDNQLPFVWYGETFTAADTIIQTLPGTGTECDTIRTLVLKVEPQIEITLEQTVCDNQLPFVWFGETFTAADTIIQIVPGTGTECDTIRTLVLNIEPQIEITLEQTVCDNQLPFVWLGETFTAADTIIQIVPGTGTECDTIRTLVLKVEPQIEITLEQTICDNQLPFVWLGATFTAADTIVQTLPGTGAECDTIRTLVLKVEPQIEITLEQTICDNQLPFVWLGETFTAADTIIQVLTGTGTECDTIRTLLLKVEPQIEITLEQTICDNQLPFVWLGATFTAADTIIQTLPATGGECDTIRTLVLKVEPQIEITLEQTVCDNQLPFVWYGATFTAADTIIQLVPGAGGECDTIRTLVLNIEPETEITLERTICENQLPFVWYGETFLAADTIVQNVQGTGTDCDTIRTLIVNVLPELSDTIRMIVCESDLPVDWFGQSINTEGMYPHKLTSVAGCDSIVVLILDIELEVPVTVAITASNTEILEGESVTFTATPVNGGDNPVYTWYVNNVIQTGHTSAVYTYNPKDADAVWATIVSDHPCAIDNPERSNVIVIQVGAPGLDCPPTLVLECGVDAIPGLFASLQEFLNAGGKVEGQDKLNLGTFTGKESYTGTCPDTIIRTYTIRDHFGVPRSCIQLVIIRDTRPPDLAIGPKRYTCYTDVPPAYTTLEEFIRNGGTAGDLCELDPSSFRLVDEVSDSTMCPETITRYYEIYDMCGNRAEAREVITVHDTISPKILACPADVKKQGGTLEELTGLPFSVTETPITLADSTRLGISATDNCAIANITWRDESEGTCNPMITRIFTVYDSCGNSDTCIQNITLANEVEPLFFAIGPVCQFTAVSPLPNISQNGITGTWNPAVVNTDVAGPVTLIFTPDDGQCAINDTMVILVMGQITPEFTLVTEYCQFETVPALPGADKNGVTGSWEPAAIDTETFGIKALMFIPDTSWACADTFRIEVEVYEFIRPELEAIGPLCQFATAPQLPPTDMNGVAGTWSPSVIPTSVADTLYFVFTPDNNRCSVTDSIRVIILDHIVPVFDLTDEICQFETPPALSSTDLNGITGTWSPAVITATVPGDYTFTFTPDASYGCSEPVEYIITVIAPVVTQFEALGPYCQGDTPGLLPLVSNNGVRGTWSPATIATDKSGFETYIFTPNPDQCATVFEMVIEITEPDVPEFAQLGPYCLNTLPGILPRTSVNGITGRWALASIITSEPGTKPYTFTPDAGQCALPFTMNIDIEDDIIPVFAPIGPLCLNEEPPALPLTSVNGITGTWKPSVIDTKESGPKRYVFTPDASEACAVEATITVSVISNTPPVANNDFGMTIRNVAFLVDVTSNDTDSNGGAIDPGSVEVVKNPSRGTVSVNPVTGAITYTPEMGFTGRDTIVYSVCDNGIPCGPLCDTAMVFITVRPPNNPPVAVNDTFTVMCFPLIGYVLPNDYDPDGDRIRILPRAMRNVEHGRLDIQPDGAFVYMPDEGFVGIDSFVYRIYDNGFPELWDEALVWINVLPSVDCDGLPDDPIDIPAECALLIPEGFSPNGDGVHDYFQIFCIEKYPQAVMRIFDRGGNKLFQKHNYGNTEYWGSEANALWGGNSEHRLTLGRGTLPAGTYLYVLELGNGEVRTGTVMVAY